MNKRRGVIIVAVLVVALVAFSSVFASNQWDGAKKEKGIVVGQGGIAVVEPSRKEVKQFIESFDPITGQPTGHLAHRGVNNNLRSAKITIIEDDLKEEVSVDYYDEGGKYTVFPSIQNQRAFYIITMPKTSLNLIVYEGQIYQLDMITRIAKPILKDSISGYKREDAIQDSRISWGSNPRVNRDGTAMVFFTNRLGLTKPGVNKDHYYEMWYKNLITGDEHYVADGSYDILAWEAEKVYLMGIELTEGKYGEVGAYSVFELDLKSGELRRILYGLHQCAVSYPYFVYTISDSTVRVLDLQSATEKTVPALSYEWYRPIISTSESRHVIIAAAPKRTERATDIIILDCETLQTSVFSESSDFRFERYGFIDAQTIAITVFTSDGKEETYVIDLQGWR